jgi:hypothetical protein
VFKGKSSETVYSDKAPISTSLFYNEAKKFASEKCCILQITVSPGSKILRLTKVSKYKEEVEILLERNGSFKVTGTRVNDDDDGMKIIFVTYSPPGSIQIEKISDGKIAEKSLDEKYIMDTILSYIMEELELGIIETEEQIHDNVDMYHKRLTGKRASREFFNQIKELLER